MSIFICNNCKNEYDKNTRKPLSLPCGHVYCQKCITSIYNFQDKSLRCPSDNVLHMITIDKIPKCAQIYSNLPSSKEVSLSSNAHKLYCQRHLHKKIKFFCKSHNAFLCSICVVDHSDHQVMKVHIDKNNFEEEFKVLCAHIDKAKNAFIVKKDKVEKYEMKVNDYYKLQMKDVEVYFSKLEDVIKSRKSELLMFYNKALSEQNYIFMKLKNKTMAITDLFIDIGNKESVIVNELLPKGYYEKFYIMRNYIEQELNKIHSEYDERRIKMFKFIPGNIGNDTLGNILDIKEKKVIHQVSNYLMQNAYKQSNCNNSNTNKNICLDGVDEYTRHLNNSFETVSSLSQCNNTNTSVINVFKNNLLSKKEIPSHIPNHNFVLKSIENKPTHFNHFPININSTFEDTDKKKTSNTTSTSKTASLTTANDSTKANINPIKQNAKPSSSRDVVSIIKPVNNNVINLQIQPNKKLISPPKNVNPVIINPKKQNVVNAYSPEMTPSTGYMSGGNAKQCKGNKLTKNYSNYNRNVIKTENSGDKRKNWLYQKGSLDGSAGNSGQHGKGVGGGMAVGERKKRNYPDVRLSVNIKQKRGNSYSKNEIQISDEESC